ncbi:hypothetical protein NLI96_g6933 [Meripilus lineatus]|uniref:Uncharacterized protein n=1 Tax=Meripilus lineatus TaxID=2056292 RepID=A0AAD5YCI0_9APHY|nr:hypothetical protein NLI96_g6933 [Physisporinus lineatus]
MWNKEPRLPFSAYFPIHTNLHHRLRVLTISDFHATSLTSIVPGVEFPVLEILQLAHLTITEPSPNDDPPRAIQTPFPQLRILQIVSSFFRLAHEETPDTVDITSHVFPQLESLELHFNTIDPSIEPSCLWQLKKLYILARLHARIAELWFGGYLDNIHDLTLPCKFFSGSRLDSGVLETLSLPRGLRILRFMAFPSEWTTFENCARLPTNEVEVKDFEMAASWFLHQQGSLPLDLDTVEVLVCLEKPKPEAEGAEAFFLNLDQFAKACERSGLIFRTVFRYVEPDVDRSRGWLGLMGEWMIDKEVFP